MSVLTVMPVPAYHQGVDRQWIKETMYDFYFPEFANLSEQAVYQGEIYATATQSENETVFGYQGAYNHMRHIKNQVSSKIRPGQSFDYWTFCRNFASAPTLNGNFVRSSYTTGFEGNVPTDPFAAPSEHKMIISVGNQVNAVRPMPVMPEPGYVDHN